MIPQTLLKTAVAAVLLLTVAHPGHAGAPKLGMAISVEGDGLLNPVVTKITVTSVGKASLAEAAGIVAGDEIVQIEGQPVVGRRARELQPLMNLPPGETRTLRLKHADGRQFDTRLTKPKE